MDEKKLNEIKQALADLDRAHDALHNASDEERERNTALSSACFHAQERFAIDGPAWIRELLADLAAVTRERDELRKALDEITVINEMLSPGIYVGTRAEHLRSQIDRIHEVAYRALKALERQPRAGESERAT